MPSVIGWQVPPGLLSETVQAFRLGKIGPADVSSAASGASFDRQLQDLLTSRLPDGDLLLMRACSAARVRSLEAARHGRLRVAAQGFQEARQIVRGAGLSAEAGHLCETFLLAAESYLEYRKGFLDRARDLIRQSLALDDLLIESGIQIMGFHRLQLAHNLMRLAIREGDPDTGLKLGAEAMASLETESDERCEPSVQVRRRVETRPRELADAMFTQITSEVALALAPQPIQEQRRLLSTLERHIQMKTTSECAMYPWGHLWLRLKDHNVNGRSELFLRSAVTMLATGLGRAPTLWYAVAADVSFVCGALANRQAKSAQDEIRETLRAEMRLPEALRKQIGT